MMPELGRGELQLARDEQQVSVLGKETNIKGYLDREKYGLVQVGGT